MTFFAIHALLLAAALALDRVAGEPGWLWSRLPHPVVLMGRLIGWGDRSLNDPDRTFRQRKLRGTAMMGVLAIGFAVLGSGISLGLHHLPGGFVVEILIAAILLAQKSLVDHTSDVAEALENGGIEAGRETVARIVGRDVSVLDEDGVGRAAMESLAENFSDAVVAPAFWFLLAGLPGLLVFKLASTADSMIGHRSPRHEAFGWAGARLDDVLNFVPARLAALLIAGAAALLRAEPGKALRVAFSDAPKHRSPNAGWPEAALAGALRLAFGGPRRYGDEMVDGAWLNRGGRRLVEVADIRRAVHLIDTAWGLLMGLAILIGMAARFLH
ncbi:adenosylcobinamide-phosphate synthase [Faunimonas pinastri]|uniref:Cobalamin biosynthesis protein CobD n=1 Tax=Faunimonas pinastri TaxID=1855383 RepID=A0A1H9DEL6_9HYPH|nr:adenosylcobinamide-phosphate synthase CbiB [Faunimonas pinastri]SEQ11831.1 adenosylcobinamide-phosphate synthase [Faunimonas pinastri]